MKALFFILLVNALSRVGYGLRFSRRRTFGGADDDDDRPKIFNYNQYLRSPYSTRVDSKSKVEALGGILKGHIQELKNTPNKQIDIIFLVDSSTSVGKLNFVEEIKFVKKLLSDFTVDANHTRVAVITFSSRERVKRHVDYFGDDTDEKHKCSLLLEDLRNINYTGGGTYTLGAFLEARKVLKKSRESARKAIFLVTDGYSNGGDPRPAAKKLRNAGIKIFTFGIQNGNVGELYDMASKPKNESTYILDSFEEFEALAKRALHEDLNSGRYIEQPDRKCNRLCVGRDCCDSLASCKCGTHTGKYECLCPPGFYGNGLRGGCQACPSGTYKSDDNPGDVRTCRKCPDENHVTEPGATSVEQCVCRKGYRNFNNNGCTVLQCPALTVPKNGYFVNDKCKNVFNAACGQRCKPGYELRGSSLRICREDGTWSGTETHCIMKTCPALMRPKNGVMICTTDDFSFNTVCRFSCYDGYKLVGSRKRTCLAIAYWTGINTRCREITCRPLPAVRDGSIRPGTCTAGDVAFGTTCTVTCHPGYTRVGPHNKQCTPAGVWDPHTEITQCLDTSAPFIMCPYNIEADTDLNENTATISWQVPLAVDNSGYVPVLSSVPAVMPPEKFPVGTTKVTYTAEDLNKNKADCHFYIVVKDKQKPTVDRCFSPLPVVSPDLYTEVTWEEPIFSDNSGQPVRIRRSHVPGLFQQGLTEVTYTAYDDSGNNNTCTLKINVIPHPCEYPPVPLNGNRTCYEDSQGVICMFTCKPGYDFTIPPAPKYTCKFDNVWEPKDQMPISDCSALELSNEVIQPASFTFAGLVACQQKVELTRLEKDFERSVTKRVKELCEEGVDCFIRDLETTCEETKAGGAFIVLGRDKRSTDEQSESRRRFRRDADVSADHLQDAEAIVTFTYTLAGKITHNSGDPAEVEHSQQKLLDVFDNIKTTLKKDAKRGDLSLEVNGRTLELYDYSLDDEPLFKCEEGSVRKERSCAKCPVGTFFNIVKKECESCPRGTFQPMAGQLSCLYCPANMSTIQPHAVSEHNCTALCLPGTFSSTGVEPCETCRKGSYQDTYGQTNCPKCPKRYSTLRRGSMASEDCKEKCVAGYVSKTGMEPCWPCPRGTYQSKTGKTSCVQCPKHADTPTTGTTDLSKCEFELADAAQQEEAPNPPDLQQAEVGFDDCLFAQPCRNGATCKSGPHGFSFECICAPGYTGVFCDQDVDECSVDPCQNGATCVDMVADYTCNCPLGYTGKKCQIDIDDCAEVVCQHGGSCQDDVATFTCNCAVGFTGQFCEVDVDECASNPCFNGGQCEDQPGGFTCTCPEGLGGLQCEIDEDSCASGPCLNDATCTDQVNGFSCTCKPGYEGEMCEIDINECASNPCMAPATCIDLVADYSCECPRGKAGLQCDQDIDEKFQLDFPSTASTTDYAMVDMETDLTSVSVCFWMKTDDTVNQGTPFSYANADGFNMLTLTDYDGFVLYVNDDTVTTTIKANDGLWHHICVLWSSNRGSWKIYMDGLPMDSGRNLANGQVIKGGGVFVIGQEQDALGGGFSSPESFIGQLTQLNVWSRELTLEDIESLRMSCEKKMGDVLAWTDLADKMYGAVSDSHIDFCKDCSKPADVDYGTVEYSGLGAGSVATYSCIRGFNLAGRRTRLCLVTGEWEGKAPTCTRISCGYPGSIEHGWIEGERFTFDNRVRYHCDRGYKLVGSETQYCGEFGFWEPGAPVCEQIKCLIPALSENTLVIDQTHDNKYAPGTDVFFECTAGNRFYTDHTSVYCQRDGTWDKSIPTCDPQKCQSPPDVDHARFINPGRLTEFAVGAVIQYECEFGFTLSLDTENPDGKLTCLANGQWETILPTCKIIDCGEPPSIANGDFFGNGFTFLEQVSYRCNAGYELSHTDILECLEDGHWTPEPPSCNAVSCNRPDDILHGFFRAKDDSDRYVYNDQVTYGCNLGYKLVGQSVMTCLQNSSWSVKAPVCKPVSCGSPGSIEDGRVIGRDYILNSVVTYVCNPGFNLVGANERLCRETGKWTPNAPVCERVECSTPPTIANGFFRGTDFLYQDNVTYECDNGFSLVGTATLTCSSTAEWSPEIPFCEMILCPRPPLVEHATYRNPNRLFFYRIGSKISYNCNPGYEMSANSLNPRGEIECLNTGLWEDSLPECQRISCPEPPAIQDGKSVYDSTKYRDTVVYQCDEGYSVKGKEQLTCQADGTWSGTPPNCLLKECKAPEYLLNGELNYKSLTPLSVIRYTCNEGYTLVGQEIRRCLANLTWSGEEPSCQPVDCGQPEQIPNGELLFEDTHFKDTCTYTCSRGYNRVGDRTRVCGKDGKWSGSAPVCELVHCDRPARVISNGRMIGESFTYGSVISYQCDPGYVMDGVSNTRTCLETGEWDSPIPVCTAVECPRLRVRHGQTSGFQTEYGTTLTITCRNGYRLVGPAERTCQQDGTWGEGETTCVPYACPRLQPPDNGQVHVQANSIAVYGCLEGYTLNGDSVLNCLDNDTWSAAPPTCDALECEDLSLKQFLNGRMAFTSFSFGSTVTFECNIGYILRGARRIECMSDGSWSADMPVCEKITCFPPFVADKSWFQGSDLTYGATIEFFCEEGYQAVGANTRTCQADGSWSGESPVCEAVVCPRPEPNPNVIVIGTLRSYGSVLEYRCNEGYRLNGPDWRNCTENGQWSGTEPSCTRNECPPTPDLANGRVLGTASGPGEQIRFSCNEGYHLAGLPFKFCLRGSLQWSNPDPSCVKVHCPDPPALPNGFHIGDEFFYQDTAEYGCNPGFELVGKSKITCLSSGQWSRRDGECLKISCGEPPLPQHVQFSLPGDETEGVFNDTANLSCVEGYLGKGISFTRCQANGAWTTFDFHCEIVECPPFRPVPHGKMKGEGRTFGSVVEIECDEGYYLVGKSSRKCEGDGNWGDEFEPYCERVQCEELSQINNGQTLVTDRTFGSVAEFRCDEGFRLHGSARRECRSDGKWSENEPYCQLVICSAPPLVEHANEFDSRSEYLYKSEARYVCEQGYAISSGDAVLSCSVNGDWIGTVPTCSLIQCGEPTHLENGKVLIASYNYLSEAQYLCYPGYRLKGSRTVTCDETGNWKGSGAECVPIDCGEPPYVANSKIDVTGDYTFNSEVFYFCDVGFVLSGQQSTTCLASGVWSGQAPLCEPISCGPPPSIQNAEFVGDSFYYLDRITYKCLEGYILNGNNVLQCNYDGSWLGERPECELLTCGPAPVLPHSSTTLTGGTGLNAVATFHCNDGYYLVGSATSVCREDLTWGLEGNDPFCQPVNCGLPPEIGFGKVIFTSTAYESSAIFECNKGYVMTTEGQLVCDKNGKWRGTTATCNPVSCGQPKIGKNVNIKGNTFTFGSTIEFSCDTGYRLHGANASFCTETGVWSEDSPRCERVTCRRLSIPENGIKLSGDMKSVNVLGDKIELGCLEGYKMVGEGSLECLPNGQWSARLPTCRLVSKVFCGKPHLRDFINVVRISGNSYFYGDKITYRCRAGVAPANTPPEITCQADGLWDGDIACGVTCKRPCQNGGICLGLNRCKCSSGYGGEVCQDAICILPCLNGGKCAAPYKCSCPPGYEGSRCQRAICNKSCAHGGKCVKPNKCRCRYGYGGQFCDKKVL